MTEPMNGYAFHPAVQQWLGDTFGAPTEPQAQGWPAIQAGRHTLIAAPTGSGKTLAAFLAAIDDLVRQGGEGTLEDGIQVLYISPLKALSNDIERNLRAPLAGIGEALGAMGLPQPAIRVAVRTGDTPAAERAAMLRRPPHIFVTTPESFYILITSAKARALLRSVRTVIVDEIHAVTGDKRGAHLALSLERLAHLAARPPVRIGLSATQRPIEEVARFLVGTRNIAADGRPDCAIVDVGHRRRIDLGIELPASPLETVMSGEVWGEIYQRLAELSAQHRSTLIFVNTRAMSERVARALSQLIGEEHVATHHGSLSREKRLEAEQRLKAGTLRVMVATASLELGIDIGAVDLVCQLGTTRAIATLLQRAGRSGHFLGGLPKARLFPLSRDELLECAALLNALQRKKLEHLAIPQHPLDILAQQIVAMVACEEWDEAALLELVRAAYPFRNLSRKDYEAVLRMLAEGYSFRVGRRGAYLHRDAVNGRLRPRKGARLTAITCGGAIPDNADFQVVLDHNGLFIGTVNEDFAIESIPGDIFQLGNTAWQIVRVAEGRVRVQDAHGQPPTIPFWLGEAPGRSDELSAAVSRMRAQLSQRLEVPTELLRRGDPDAAHDPAQWVVDGRDTAEAMAYLTAEVGLDEAAALQLASYMLLAKAALGVIPTQDTLVLERFFDEAGGMQLVIHSPFGSRLNRAWGLALRKRFCRSFNFELQAAALEDAIVISLGPMHSFPLEDVFHFLSPATVRGVLIQAMLDAPLFEARWRWNATRALAVPRFRGGKKNPPQLQRIQANDLLALVFPDQQACLENIQGDRELPDHPLVNQTVADGLQEAMDLAGLERLLSAMAAGEKTLLARDLREPSPLAQQVLSARPYAFLDDAPLEERRTRAVASRRWLDPQQAADLGALDAAAIARVRHEAWPQAETPDELHDALLLLGFLTEPEGLAGPCGVPAVDNVTPLRDAAGQLDLLGTARRPDDGAADNGAAPDPGGWAPLFAALQAAGRAALLQTTAGARLWVAAERLPELLAALTGATLTPPIAPPPAYADKAFSPQQALTELVRGRLEGLGPVTTPQLARDLELAESALEAALIALEAEGFVLRGQFTPRPALADHDAELPTEWCERRLLARIHRYTMTRLRQEIEPLSVVQYLRFLLTWQRVAPGSQGEGPESLRGVVEQLEGFESPAGAWETALLPARIAGYEAGLLDGLCLTGRIVWARLSRPGPGRPHARVWAPVRATPMALVPRAALGLWQRQAPGPEAAPALSADARAVRACLQEHGATFFADLQSTTRLLQTQLEVALGELVAWGCVTADSFAGLRALLVPSAKRPAPGRRRVGLMYGMDSAGRWATLARPAAQAAPAAAAAAPVAPQRPPVGTSLLDRVARPPRVDPAARAQQETDTEAIARVLLRRYGVVFRRLLERESLAPPWRDLLRVYRRLEARGEIRGGRFVDGMAGEQYALPEAVGLLRNQRRRAPAGDLVAVSGADPLNLVGIVTPGPRVPAITANRVLFRDGEPIATRDGGRVRWLSELDPQQRAAAERVLARKLTPPLWRQRLEQTR